MRVVSAAVAALVLAAAGSAHAAIVVDVDNLVLPPAGTHATSSVAAGSGPLVGNVELFQTWTPTVQGELAALDIFSNTGLFASPPTPTDFTFTLSIYLGDVRQAGSVQLGQLDSSSLPLFSSPAVHSFDLTGLSIFTTPGEVMTLGFSIKTCDPSLNCAFGAADSFYAAKGGPLLATSNGYAGGQEFWRANGAFLALPDDPASGSLSADRDFSFKVSVDNGLVAPVPEPGAWALMLSGMFGAGAMMRRRRLVALPLSS